MSIDGVLRDASGLPIREGLDLYEALCVHHRVVLASDSPERDEQWLKMEGLRSHQEIAGIPPAFLRGTHGLRLAQAEALLGGGGDLSLVVDADPTAVLEATMRGIPAVLFVHPKFARPEWRADYSHIPRPWDELVAEIETQRTLAANMKPLDQ